MKIKNGYFSKSVLAWLYLITSFSAVSQSHSNETSSQTKQVEDTKSLPQVLLEQVEQTVEQASDEIQTTDSVLDNRAKQNLSAKSNPFVISQYRQNYLLPITFVKDPNPLSVDGLTEENVDNFEAKYQVSVNLPIYIEDESASGLYFGLTLRSFWQVYNSDVSKPFRENIYEPEVYYQWNADWDLFGYRFNQAHIGFNHQSNGQDGLKSRSWNRIYASFIFSDVNSLYYFKTWYRVPEDEKEFLLDPEGDDNPDINDFVGRAEFGYAFNMGDFRLLSLLRNNLSTSSNRGSIEFNLTYPINDRYEWLLQYFNGYGDSLIDYNRHQQRIGLGIQLRFL
ncbi:phospholipase A [Glaciecola sp. KUL10]|uniref:phospholipase A n=1 Tax=Glaciecola sp. (strain KUL10) TaxID=2161813 RepID=UPI000D789ABC|nr:phospholipase A [Glaciecola sp. KUL10]GBL04737.1 outer membrane phospholipase A [Glaciecola sp. KUL10]